MINTPSMQDLLEAGVHFGHKVSRGNPRMKDYLFGAREGVHIIDLEKSEAKLKEAIQASYELGKQNKTALVVGTKKQAQDIVKELALEVGAFYINIRWPGGLLTNFDEIRKSFKKLNDLKVQQEKGELSRYTKKEQLLISKKLDKYTFELGGVAQMEAIPNVMFVIDAVTDLIAIKEAQKVGMTIIGLCDSNADPSWFDYPVPANDDGIKSIKVIAEALIRAYGQGKKEAGVAAEKQAKKEADDKAKAEAKVLETEAAPDEVAAIEEEIEQAEVKDAKSIV
jgi:small subunit ribosomal protein S2